MIDILKSKGFTLNHCNISKENFWEYTDDNGNDRTNELARMFGLDEEQDIDYVVLQCKEDFSDCKVAANDLVWSLNQEEFFKIVSECM